MRKSILYLIISTTLPLLLASCQKVINLNLSASPSQIVIQGNVYDVPGPYVITISKSVAFDQPNIFPPVSGATVTIGDNTGFSEQLIEKEAGKYVTTGLQGVPGHTYTLTVNVDGDTYTATSFMPQKVNLDSVYIDRTWAAMKVKMVAFQFQDPDSADNYYRMVLFKDSIQQDNIIVFNNRFVQGKQIQSMLRLDDDTFTTGSLATLWLECIDKDVYTFFSTAHNADGGSTSPANPISNISNGALGCFNACTISAKSIITP